MENIQDNLKKEFTDWYNTEKQIFCDDEETYKKLIEKLVSKCQKITSPKIESRVKSLDSCINKIERKYLEKNEEISCQEIRKKITDFIGIRIICFYEDEIHIIKEIIEKEFEIVGETDKTKEREEKETFGYRGLHLDVRMKENRRDLPEYRECSDFSVEIQIRSVIQDAWSRLEHKIIYKKNVPISISRSAERLAALFEIADSEFIRLRDKTKEQEKKSREQITKLENGDTNNINESAVKIKIDFITFDKFLKLKFQGYTFSQENENNVLNEIFNCKSDFCLSDLDRSYKEKITIVEDFKKGSQISMNPFTMLRHILYAFDKKTYKNLLTQKQRKAFDDYLKSKDK